MRRFIIARKGALAILCVYQPVASGVVRSGRHDPQPSPDLKSSAPLAFRAKSTGGSKPAAKP